MVIVANTPPTMRFRDIVQQRLKEMGVSPITAARTAGLKRDSIRGILRGRAPSIDRAAEICAALGLEFYIGPARSDAVAPPRKQLTAAQRAVIKRAVQDLADLLDDTNPKAP